MWFAAPKWLGGWTTTPSQESVQLGAVRLCDHSAGGGPGWTPLIACLAHCPEDPGAAPCCARCGAMGGTCPNKCTVAPRAIHECSRCLKGHYGCACSRAALILAALAEPHAGAPLSLRYQEYVARIRRGGSSLVDASWSAWPSGRARAGPTAHATRSALAAALGPAQPAGANAPAPRVDIAPVDPRKAPSRRRRDQQRAAAHAVARGLVPAARAESARARPAPPPAVPASRTAGGTGAHAPFERPSPTAKRAGPRFRVGDEVVELPPLVPVQLPWTRGWRRSHCAAYSTLVGCEIATAQVAGVACSDGLRIPVAWKLVDGKRGPLSERWTVPEGACTITLSPAGYRAYSGEVAAVGTALIWRRPRGEADDSVGWMSDPEIVLATFRADDARRDPAAAVGSAITHDRGALYAALCPTLEPWMSPSDTVRAEVIVAAATTARAALPFVLEGDQESAETVLRFADGLVEHLARRRLGDLVEQTPAYRPAPLGDAPSPRRSAVARAADELVRSLGWSRGGEPPTSIVAARRGGGCALEEAVCANWNGQFVRINLAVAVIPHGGGGPAAARKTLWRARQIVAGAKCPATDATVVPGGVIYLPAYGSDEELEDAKALVAAAIGQSGTRPDAAADMRDPGYVVVAERDTWLAAPFPANVRAASAAAPGSRMSSTSTDHVPRPRPAAARFGPWNPAARPVVRPLAEQPSLTAELLRFLGTSDPAAALEHLDRARRETRATRGLAIDSRPAESEIQDRARVLADPRVSPHGAAAVTVGAPFVPPPKGGAGRQEGTTVSAALFPGFPRFRAVLQPSDQPRVPADLPLLTGCMVRRAVLAPVLARPTAAVLPPPVSSRGDDAASSSGYPASRSEPGVVPVLTALAPDQFADAAATFAHDPWGAPLVRTTTGWALAGQIAVRISQVHPAARPDAYAALAFLVEASGWPARDASVVARLFASPAFAGGNAVRKSVATAAHMRLLAGAGARDETPDEWCGELLLDFQRYLSRGLFFSSTGTFIAPPRRRVEPRVLDGHDVGPAVLRWVAEAAARSVAEARSKCAAAGCEDKPGSRLAPAYCPRHAVTELKALQRGGGTIAASRRSGGGHAVMVAYARGAGIQLAGSMSDVEAIRAAVHDDDLDAVAVWTAVYPTNQVGARMQETPGVKLMASALVARAALAQTIARDWMVPLLRPPNGRRVAGLRGERLPLVAMDATACSDAQAHDVIMAIAAAADPVIDRPTTERALLNLTSYDSVAMSAADWAERSAGRYELDIQLERPVRGRGALTLQGKVRQFGVLSVVGATGSGKTRALAAAPEALTLCLPTRLAIRLSAEDAHRQDGRRSDVIHFEAGTLDPDVAARRRGSPDFAVPGAAYFDGSWHAMERDEVSSPRAYGTPYQLREAAALAGRVAVVDEVHERDCERMLTLATLYASGQPFVVASATLPPELASVLAVDLSVELPARQGSYTVAAEPLEQFSRKLVVCGSVRECLARAELEPGAASLHGLQSAADQERAVALGGTVCATVGVVASAITIPGVDYVVVTESARKVRRYVVGTGVERSTLLSRDELLQIVGRAGRTTGTGYAYLEPARGHGARRPCAAAGTAPSWREAVEKAVVATEVPARLDGTCRENLFDQARTLGNPSVRPEIAALALQLLGASPGALPLLRAAFDALSDWLGVAPDRLSSLAAEDLREFEQGLDPGTLGGRNKRFDGHSALTEKVLPITPWYARGVVARSGAGFYGSYGVMVGARQGNAETRDALLIAQIGVPSVREPVCARVLFQGATCEIPGVRFGPADSAVGDRERAVLGGRPRVRNTAGTPMGASSNGAVVNSAVSNAARAADAAALWLEEKILDGSHQWRGPAPGWTAASLCATGGDDELDQGGPIRERLGLIFRVGIGAPPSLAKTGATPHAPGRSEVALVPRDEGARARLSRALGPELAASAAATLAPFLEYYYSPDGRVFTPRPWAASVRLIAGILTGDACVDVEGARHAGRRAVDWIESTFQSRIEDVAAVSQQLVDNRPATGYAPPPCAPADVPPHERIDLPEWLWRPTSGPTAAGRFAGSTYGAAIVSAVAEERVRRGEADRCPECGAVAAPCDACKLPACCRHVCVPHPVGEWFVGAAGALAAPRAGDSVTETWPFPLEGERPHVAVGYAAAGSYCQVCLASGEVTRRDSGHFKCADCIGKQARHLCAPIVVVEVPEGGRWAGPVLGVAVRGPAGLRGEFGGPLTPTARSARLGASVIAPGGMFLAHRTAKKARAPAGWTEISTSRVRIGSVERAAVPGRVLNPLLSVCALGPTNSMVDSLNLVAEWIADGAPLRTAAGDPPGWEERDAASDDAEAYARLVARCDGLAAAAAAPAQAGAPRGAPTAPAAPPLVSSSDARSSDSESGTVVEDPSETEVALGDDEFDD